MNHICLPLLQYVHDWLNYLIHKKNDLEIVEMGLMSRFAEYRYKGNTFTIL